MSVISEQVKELREKAQVFEDSGCATNGIVKTFREAADTIEKLSAKLADVNMERSTAYYNDGWIPCNYAVPLNDDPDVWDWIEIKRANGEILKGFCWSSEPIRWWVKKDGKQFEIKDAVEWRPLPEPYKGGGVDER